MAAWQTARIIKNLNNIPQFTQLKDIEKETIITICYKKSQAILLSSAVSVLLLNIYFFNIGLAGWIHALLVLLLIAVDGIVYLIFEKKIIRSVFLKAMSIIKS